ncbi:MAG: hypothetical protein ACO31I_05575 [Prochlorotrichaceae cyanobacterium]|jgi:hypothetical protein
MRILRKTADSLTLSLCPLRMWVLSGALTSLGLVILLGLGRMTALRCDRFGLATGSCSLETLSLLQSHYQIIEIRDIYRADTDWLYRITLQTPSGNLPLTFPYAAIDWEQQLVMNQINDFLDNSTAIHLEMTQDGRAFAYPFGVSFFLGGLLLACYFGSIAVYEINQAQKTVTLKRQGMLGQSIRQFDFQDVATLQVEAAEQPLHECHISMQLRSGQTIPLSPRYPLDRQEARHLVQTLQTYLQN